MPVPQTAVKDLQDDIFKVKGYLEVVDDIETKIALLRLEEILKSWRVGLLAKGK